MAVILAVVVAVTPAVVVAADRRRLTVLPAAVAADKATPAMEDTNTNPDMCSPGEDDLRAQSRRLPAGFPDWTTQTGPTATSRLVSSIDRLDRLRVIKKRTSIREADSNRKAMALVPHSYEEMSWTRSLITL